MSEFPLVSPGDPLFPADLPHCTGSARLRDVSADRERLRPLITRVIARIEADAQMRSRGVMLGWVLDCIWVEYTNTDESLGCLDTGILLDAIAEHLLGRAESGK
jgi:hypothetical protein